MVYGGFAFSGGQMKGATILIEDVVVFSGSLDLKTNRSHCLCICRSLPNLPLQMLHPLTPKFLIVMFLPLELLQ